MSEKRRYNSKKIFGSLLWALLGLATVVLLGAAISLRNNKHCKAVDININGSQNNFFIDKNAVTNILETLCGGKLQGKPLGRFNLALIEKSLKKNEWIKNAELFFDNNEVLHAEINEREPLARIFTSKGSSFYLDSSLTVLPLSDKSSARVPVFSNFPAQQNELTKADTNLLVDIKNISSYILKDPFWMAQIDQVDITADRNFEMVPKMGNQIIVFGNAENYAGKFNNLLAYYKQVATKVGWNTYSKINVQYNNQIVAVKRGAEDVTLDLLRTKQIMEGIVAAAQKQSSDSIKNIQLDQQQDDNIVPVAPHFDNTPDEQTITDKPESVIAAPVKTVSTSHEKPNPTPSKIIAPEKKISLPAEKPFWLKSAADKPPRNVKDALKKSATVKKSSLIKKIKPNPAKKIIVLKPATKAIKKPVIQPVNKIKTKPKAVLPPKNDY